MKKIDCFGDICPIPLLKMQAEIDRIPKGETFQMVVDHSCVVQSIQEHLKNSSTAYSINEVLNGVWEITITKHD